ncbi:MAG: hypothetical protein ABI550_02010 [Ignavibacteriaceae bacterium]
MLKFYFKFAASLILLNITLMCQSNSQDQLKIFQENLISTGEYETHPAFTSTDDTLYFLKCLPDANFCSICVSYNKDDKWSDPQVVSFSGKYVDVPTKKK